MKINDKEYIETELNTAIVNGLMNSIKSGGFFFNGNKCYTEQHVVFVIKYFFGLLPNYYINQMYKASIKDLGLTNED